MGVMRRHVRSRPPLRRTIGQSLLFPRAEINEYNALLAWTPLSAIDSSRLSRFNFYHHLLPGRSVLFGLSPLFTWT